MQINDHLLNCENIAFCELQVLVDARQLIHKPCIETCLSGIYVATGQPFISFTQTFKGFTSQVTQEFLILLQQHIWKNE